MAVILGENVPLRLHARLTNITSCLVKCLSMSDKLWCLLTDVNLYVVLRFDFQSPTICPANRDEMHVLLRKLS